MANSWGKNGNSNRLYFLGSKITADGDCSHEIKRCLLLGRKAMTNLDSILKSRDITWPTKFCSQSYGFSSSHVQMWELDHKESWVSKDWCFRTVVLEKTLESPLDSKEIQPDNPKRNQSWILIGRTDAEAEAPVLWPPDAKSWIIWKDPDAGKDGGQEEKGATEDEMVGWHHGLQWTWVWANSGRYWRTGKPGVLQSMGSQRDTAEWPPTSLCIYIYIYETQSLSKVRLMHYGQINYTSLLKKKPYLACDFVGQNSWRA